MASRVVAEEQRLVDLSETHGQSNLLACLHGVDPIFYLTIVLRKRLWENIRICFSSVSSALTVLDIASESDFLIT